MLSVRLVYGYDWRSLKGTDWFGLRQSAVSYNDELLARSQYRAPGLRLVGLWLWFVLSEVAMVWLFSLVAKLFFLLCRLPAMGFYPPPLSLPFLLFSFPPSSSLRSSQAFFGSSVPHQ
jgi:hypothetical protein